MPIPRSLLGLTAILVLASVSLPPLPGSSQNKEIIVNISYGDQLAYAPEDQALVSPERFDSLFAEYAKAGVDTVFFRVEDLRVVTDFEYPDPRITYKDQPPIVAATEFKRWHGSREAVRTNLLKHIVDSAHAHGLKIFALSSIFNEGMPLDQVWWMAGEHREGLFTKITRKPAYSSMISRFVAHHPSFVMVDRSQQKRNWGTLRAWRSLKRAPTPCPITGRFLENYPSTEMQSISAIEFGTRTLATVWLRLNHCRGLSETLQGKHSA